VSRLRGHRGGSWREEVPSATGSQREDSP
jgi:hypothetical protein